MGNLGPEALLDVPGWGTVAARWQRAGHCSASAESMGNPGNGVIWFKGQRWYVNFGFHVENGRARIGSNDRTTAITTGGGKAKDLARSYQGNLIGSLTDALNDFMAKHPEVLTEAERCHLRTEAERAQRDIADAEEQLGAAKAALYDINEKLKALPPERKPS